MQQQDVNSSISNFYMAGISYERASTAVRSLFAINDTDYENLAASVSQNNISGCCVLSTCNRTEIYGFAAEPNHLIEFLCNETQGTADQFLENAKIYRGQEAVRHLYEVTCGLDSQILGDFEITYQVKEAARKAKKAGLLDTFTERIVNNALQVSKTIRNKTEISSGTASVSFAAVQFLKQIPNIEKKNILLLGMGKIGHNTCKNILHYIDTKNITLINRTEEKACSYAQKYDLNYAPMEQLSGYLQSADIVLVATDAPNPTIHSGNISPRNKLIFDLSIPHNVSDDVRNSPGIRVLDVDELSKIQDETLQLRQKEIIPAQAIIDEELEDFFHWYRARKHAAVLRAIKEKMERISKKAIEHQHKKTNANVEDLESFSQTMVQKMLNAFAGKMNGPKDNVDFFYHVLAEVFEVPMDKNDE